MTHRDMCYRCFKAKVVCLCDCVTAIENRTRIIILQHPDERRHPIGTARIALLALARAERVVCPKKGALPAAFQPGEALLFPSADARDLETLDPDEAPGSLMILDGTWPQAKAIYRANPRLAGVPHYRLNPESPSRYRIRKEPRLDYISTIESIVIALQALEPDTPNVASMLDVFDTMVDEQIRYQRRNTRFVPTRDLKRAAEAE